MGALLLALVVGLAAPPPVAWLPLARSHLAAGRLDRAVKALQGARACWAERGEACGFARADYDALLGAVYVEAGQPAPAAKALTRALEAQPDRPPLWLYLGQARLALGEPAAAAQAFERGAAAAADDPVLYALWARAHREAEQPAEALTVLHQGLDRVPTADLLRREAVALLASVQLIGPARALAAQLTDPAARRQAHRALASALYAAGDPRAAAEVIEQLLLFDPDDLDAQEQRARLWAAAGAPAVAARLYARLARQRPAAWHAAAGQAQRAGQLAQALRWNARVPDLGERLAQRLDLLLAAERWPAAHALGPRLTAPTDGQRYRLAYAALRAGHPTDALRLANSVQGAAHRASARRLAEAARDCVQAPGRCP